MEQLMKGKTVLEKWYVRPVNWAGIWNDNWKLVSGNTLFQTDKEEEADLYIDVYKLINMVNEKNGTKPQKELFVYRMDDYEWWVSDVNEEETANAYCDEYGVQLGSDIEVDDITVCSLVKDGMYWNFNDEEIDALASKLLGNERLKTIVIGDLSVEVAMCDGPSVWIPFEKAIKLDGPYEKPHMIACTEW